MPEIGEGIKIQFLLIIDTLANSISCSDCQLYTETSCGEDISCSQGAT